VDNAVFNICLCIITTAACPDCQNIITDSHSKDSSPHHHPLVSHSISRKQKSFGVSLAPSQYGNKDGKKKI